MIDTNNTEQKWYREFWAWFVFAPLIIVVLVSAVTVTLAFTGADVVVKGDYEKDGRMLKEDFSDTSQALSRNSKESPTASPSVNTAE